MENNNINNNNNYHCNQYSSSAAQPKGENFSQYNKAVPVSLSHESNSFLVPYWPHVATSPAFQFYGFPSINPIEDKATAASKSHSQAEKRRRDRINAQLSTLRKLIPKSDKMDKAALLASVIDHVKDLKRKAGEVGKSSIIPSEIDEIVIDGDLSDMDVNVTDAGKSTSSSGHKIYIRASVCCDDRPELFSELIQVIKGLRLRAVKADVASIGGRIKSVLILCSKDNEEATSTVCLNTLKQSLKLVLSKIASSSSLASNCRIRSKRQRFFLPNNNSHFSDQ